MSTVEAEAGRMVARLIGDTSGFVFAMKQAQEVSKTASQTIAANVNKVTNIVQKQFSAMGSFVRSFGGQLRNLGIVWSLTIGLMSAGVLKSAVHEFAQFEGAMIRATAIMDVTEHQAREMWNAAIGLSTSGTVSQSAKELADALYYLAAAGFDAESSLKGLPIVSQFAMAGNFELEKATELLTDSQAALGMKVKDAAQNMINMQRVSDVMAKAGDMSSVSLQQMAEAITNGAGAKLRMFNKTVEEGAALLAVYAEQGEKGMAAGTRVTQLMGLMSKLANSKQFGARMRADGINVFDDTGKMANFADIVGQMEKALAGLTDQEKSAKLEFYGFKALVQGAIVPLIGNSEKLREFEERLKSAAGTAAKTAEKNMKSFTNQMKLLENQITAVKINIGEVLAPVLLRMNEYVKTAIKTWNGFSDEFKRGVIVALAVAAALGPVLIMLGTVVMVASSAITGIAGLFGLVGTVFTLVANPLTLLIGALVLLGSVAATVFGALAIDHFWDDGAKALKSFWEDTKGFFANFQENMLILKDWVVGQWEYMVRFISGAWAGLKVMVDTSLALYGTSFGGLMDIAKTTFSGLLGFLYNFGDNFTAVIDWLQTNWKTLGTNMVTGWSDMGMALVQNMLIAAQAIKDVFWALADTIAIALSRAITGGDLGDIGEIFNRKLGEAVEAAKGKFKDPLAGFKKNLTDLPELKFGVGKLNLPEFNLDQTKKQVEEAVTDGVQVPPEVMQTAVNDAFKDVEAPVKINLKGIEAVEFNSGAARERIREFTHNREVNKQTQAQKDSQNLNEIKNGINRLVELEEDGDGLELEEADI
jgi:TP901 family phage tail tape measure protein